MQWVPAFAGMTREAMEGIDYYKDSVRPGRETRLYNEWMKMEEAFSSHEDISYDVFKRSPSGLPIAYEVTFRIPSIIGVEEPDVEGLQKPVFGEKHVLRITIPNNYPSSDGGYPDFTFVTDVWHPNVRFFGEFKGHVCLNYDNCGTSTTLAEHIVKVAAYLRYDDYFALDEEPFPEDQTVALWVREQGEVQGWTIFK